MKETNNSKSSARERMAAASKANNTGEKAEEIDPMVERLTNTNSESKEIARLKKELAKEKKLSAKTKSLNLLVAPEREVKSKDVTNYALRIHRDNNDFFEQHCKGSLNIIVNFLMREQIKLIKEQLKHDVVKINNRRIITENEEE